MRKLLCHKHFRMGAFFLKKKFSLSNYLDSYPSTITQPIIIQLPLRKMRKGNYDFSNIFIKNYITLLSTHFTKY